MKHFKNFILEHIKTPDTTKAFTIIKPGFLDYEDEIYDYIKDHGFEMYDHTDSMKMSDGQIKELYKMHKDKDFYEDLCKYMSSGECLCCKCYKECADPIEDMDKIKDEIRKKWGKDDMKNAMHSSDSLQNAARESKIVFK